MFGKLWSEEYFAVPVVFSGPSIRGTVVPIRFVGADCGMRSVSLGLRRCGRERADDATPREFDFVSIAGLRFGIAQGSLGCSVKSGFRGGLADEQMFSFE